MPDKNGIGELIMKKTTEFQLSENIKNKQSQHGSAIVIAIFVLALISVFVTIALTRTVSEAVAVSNETAEGRTFYSAQASLEMMTRNFNKIFETKLNPTTADLSKVEGATVPQHDDYNFEQRISKTSNSSAVVLSSGPYAGLYALRDNWRLQTTATDPVGVQVQLTRNVLNNRIPIFQFGIFNDDDLELYRPPRFSFGGRVHTNKNFFISPGTEGVYFDSRVTAVGQIVTQTWRNGFTGDSALNKTYIKNASNDLKQLLPEKGSVLNTSSGASDNVFAANPDMPPSKLNRNWAADSAIFDGNLQNNAPKLKLPLDLGAGKDLFDMVRRGNQVGDVFNKNGVVTPVTAADADNPILVTERFANKSGIRVTLADSKAKLPGCANASASQDCGVRLDGDSVGKGSEPISNNLLCTPKILGGGGGDDDDDDDDFTSGLAGVNVQVANPNCVRGYQPLTMKDGYIATRVNGERLFSSGKAAWIKVETVTIDAGTGAVITEDITQDILSLGVTEQAPRIKDGLVVKFEISGYNHDTISGTDSRSIIKIQRFLIPGPIIPGGTTSYTSNFSTTSSGIQNLVVRYRGADAIKIRGGCTLALLTCIADDADSPNDSDSNGENKAHLKLARVDTSFDRAIVPFPIKMFDTREGTYFDSPSSYVANKVTQNGVMSIVDIDVANLKRFLNGDFDGKFPTNTPFASKTGKALKAENIYEANGWVFYFSDRRGDYDFDGEYDMEDVYGAAPGNDGVLQLGEDLNKNGFLDTNFLNEAVKYSVAPFPDIAAVTDHSYYRRGIRLINGTSLPGTYDDNDATKTKGFTVASENGLYVKGNYNATGVVANYPTGNTPHNEYLPYNDKNHIPASIVADSVTILSNSWNDAQSFAFPYDQSKRLATDTTIRFAMISGDTIASKGDTPNQGGISPGLNGGVHNFKRFLERWSGKNLNYAGSLVNLFNSRNNNGSFKCCNTVYNPPVRNWVFDSTFLDAARLPPGTPFFQYVQTTGFERVNN